jgi:2-dehydro-3-deoxygluconokinase
MPVDVVSFGETMLRLTAPDNTRLENTSTFTIYVGGTESNTLAGLARLNCKVSWLSALPDNPLGRHVESELRSHGIDTSQVVWDTPASRLGTFYAENAPEPIGLQVYYDRANSACALIDPERVNYASIDEARILHLTGITPALSPQARDVFQRFLTRAQQKQIPLSFDINYRAKLWTPEEAAQHVEDACRQASILFCSYADAAELWGFSGDAESVLRLMAQRFGSDKNLVLTLGSKGSAHLDHGNYDHAPSFPTESNGRFGSGDAFDAGYLHAYLAEPLYQELAQHRGSTGLSPLEFGNALAALKRGIAGDIAIISPTDVKILLQMEISKRFR